MSENRTGKRLIGLIINPLAGIGGKVGLKGSDGIETVEKALKLGAERVSPARSKETLDWLSSYRDEIQLATYPKEMGEDVAISTNFIPVVYGSILSGHTTAEDTIRSAQELVSIGVELLLFAGGDGTARDVLMAIDDAIPVIGIPTGVKMHSSVFAVNPVHAAELLGEYLRGRISLQEMEVMDIDEDLFRQGRVSARLFGYLRVPYSRRHVQGAKVAGFGSSSEIIPLAQDIIDRMDDKTYFILGPGTTLKAIGDQLNIDKTLLGVDLVYGKRLIGKDLNEKQLLEAINGNQTKIVVTVIGGQGYIFGRGNQQISPRVIRSVGKENIIIVSTRDKLISLDGPLYVDTGDRMLDQDLKGYTRVVTGYRLETAWKVDC
jgi:predicted polyphosphate/ATP-dependent NAD kinase